MYALLMLGGLVCGADGARAVPLTPALGAGPQARPRERAGHAASLWGRPCALACPPSCSR